MRHLAIVANSGWNLFNYRRPLMRHFKDLGWNVTLISPPDHYIDQIAASEYDAYLPLQHLSSRSTSILKDFQLILELRRVIRRQRFDLILSYTVKPNVYLPMVTRIPIFATVTGLGSAFIQEGKAAGMIRNLYKRGYRNRNYLAFHNDDDRRLFEKEGIIDMVRTAVIPGSGVEIVAQEEQKLDTGRFIFLFLGRMMKEKGVEELLTAANDIIDRHASVSFILAGEWMENGGLDQKKLIRQTKSDRISYIGHVDDLSGLWTMCDCLVLPSYREGMPKSVLEAMAHQKLVVATDVPGCRQAVEHEKTGFLVEPRSVESLKQGLERVLAMSPTERSEMELQAYKRAKNNFDQKVIVKHYTEIATSILSKNLVGK